MVFSLLKPIPALSETALFHFSRYIITLRNKAAIRCKLHLIPLSPNKHISILHLRKSSGSEDSYTDFVSCIWTDDLHIKIISRILERHGIVFFFFLILNRINTINAIGIIYVILLLSGA